VLALIGDQFDEEDRVCGCVLSIRSQEDIISVWHQDEKDAAAKERIKYAHFIIITHSMLQ
jgi:translation initiation factor 4E